MSPGGIKTSHPSEGRDCVGRVRKKGLRLGGGVTANYARMSSLEWKKGQDADRETTVHFSLPPPFYRRQNLLGMAGFDDLELILSFVQGQ